MPLRHAFSVLVGVCAVAAAATLAAQSSAPSPSPQSAAPAFDGGLQFPLTGQPAPQFRVGTTLVPLDVRVIDATGKPVTDLTEADFAILEDDVPQAIAHFSTQAFVPAAPSGPDTRPRRASDAFELTSPNQRTFLIAFGRGWLEEPSGGVSAIEHLLRDRLMPQDQVAIMAWNRVTDFTTDRTETLALLDRLKHDHGGIDAQIVLWERSLARIYGDGRLPPFIQRKIDAVFAGATDLGVRATEGTAGSLRHIEDQIRRFGDRMLGLPQFEPVGLSEFNRFGSGTAQALRSATFFDFQMLYAGVDYLRHLTGAKHLIFVSEFGVSGPQVEADRSIGRMAADARVTLNIIHSGGVPFGDRGPAFTPRSTRFMIESGQTARLVAKTSGGQFYAHKFHRSSDDIDRIDETTRFQYTLAYYPQREPVDGKYRRIRVRVTRPGLTVLSREGYFARTHVGPLERKSALVFGRVAGAAEHPFPLTDIGIRESSAAGQRARDVRVAMTIDVSRVAFDRQADGRYTASIESAAFLVTSKQKTAGEVWQTLNLSYTDAELADKRQNGLRHEISVPMTAEADEVKIVVYDFASDLVGSAVARVGR